jgi:predicted phage terminase large subunit-like protein
LVSGIEEALSIDRLDSLWNKYTNDLKSRKKQGCKEIHIATRWSVHDPIGRLQKQYENDPRAKFIAFPALDENDESNFNYKYGVGFDTKYFHDMRDNLDDVSWKCLYMNEPIEREGLLFPEDELLTYNGVLPGTEPVRKYFACDVAWGGGDALSAPIAYEYEDGSVYIPDVVFNKGDKTITRPIVVGKLMQHLPHLSRFEANNGGDEYADAVDEDLKALGIRLNISHRKAPSTQSKLSRIVRAAPDIKKFYFLDKKHRSKEYAAFMKELTSFTQTGKNKHDDAPDSLAMLADLIYHSIGKAEVIKRPF